MNFKIYLAGRGAAGVMAILLLLCAQSVRAQEGVFLTEEQAPRAVFPEAERFERQVIPAGRELRAHVKEKLGGVEPSIWEPQYLVFHAWRGGKEIGRAFLVEEIGKHRPITFVVGIRSDGRVQDVAVVAYREAYGGQIRNRRFLVQYRGKDLSDSLQPYRAITNIAGATLSVEAAGRAVKKALALADVLGSAGATPAAAAGTASPRSFPSKESVDE